MAFFVPKPVAITLLLTLGLVCSALAQQQPSNTTSPVRKAAHNVPRKRHAVAKPSPVLPPEPPPPPPTPEQMPPVPPQVSYRNGLLSIVASNSTLADVLHAVSVRTGATVDAPANLMNERVAVRLGPGSPRDVLSDLLSGPRFDYILVGDANNPDSVRTIMLTANTSAAPSAARPSVPVAQTQPGPRQPNIPQEEVMDEEVGGAEEQVEPEQPPQQPPVQAVRPPQQPAPVVPQQFPQPGANAGENPNAQQPQVKTPEQLLEELRKLQQQQGTGQPPPQR